MAKLRAIVRCGLPISAAAHGDYADGAVDQMLGALENENGGAIVGRRNAAASHKEELSCCTRCAFPRHATCALKKRLAFSASQHGRWKNIELTAPARSIERSEAA